MRVDSQGSSTHLHFHDGTTCHGAPTLQECLDEAISRVWLGRVLEKSDVRVVGGEIVRCYSMIVAYFDHWAKHGRFVAETRVTSRVYELDEAGLPIEPVRAAR